MWAAYYAQYYSQANGASTAAAAASTDPQQQQQQQAAWAANASTSTAAAAAAGQDNEAVYQQWIEYYKACGMTKEAEAIEQKLKEFKNAKSLQKDDNNHSHNGKSPK